MSLETKESKGILDTIRGLEENFYKSVHQVAEKVIPKGLVQYWDKTGQSFEDLCKVSSKYGYAYDPITGHSDYIGHAKQENNADQLTPKL